MPFAKPLAKPDPSPVLSPVARSPFDALQAIRLQAQLALVRPQVEQALANLARIGVAARVVGSYAREGTGGNAGTNTCTNSGGRFRLGSDVDFLIENRGSATLTDVFEAIASSLRDAPFDIVYWDNLGESGREIMLETNPGMRPRSSR